MQICSSGSKLFFACSLLLLLSSSLAFAGSATVDCSGATPGAFTSINQALGSLPAAGPNNIAVSGTCTENVVIDTRADLNMFGNPTATVNASDPTNSVLTISNSQRVNITGNMVFNGGQGVVVVASSPIRFNGVSVQNSGFIGIQTADSLIHFSNGAVTGSTRSGISSSGGSLYLEANVNVSNNGRLGVSVNTAHLTVSSGGSAASIFSHNGLGGIQVFGVGQADLSGNIQITSNSGSYGLLVLNNSGVAMTNGIISGNSGLGVHCGGTSHCEFVATQISGNGAGGIEVVEHSDTSLDSGVIISGNTGNGVLVNQASSLTSEGGNTIGGNTIDGLVVDTVSVINFQATDTITATAGNLALNCNNGSFVMGDVSTYKPKKCGAAFQANPVH
jgi:hypothetical protein